MRVNLPRLVLIIHVTGNAARGGAGDGMMTSVMTRNAAN